MGFQNDGMAGGGDSDDDLEAELAALTKGTKPSREKKSILYNSTVSLLTLYSII